MSLLLDIWLRLLVAMDSRDLFTSLSTRRNYVHKSIRADGNCISYKSETGNAGDVIWIHGKLIEVTLEQKRIAR